MRPPQRGVVQRVTDAKRDQARGKQRGERCIAFILRHALAAAHKVIEQAEHLTLSERDSLRVLDALERPPAPNAKLLAAARRLPRGA